VQSAARAGTQVRETKARWIMANAPRDRTGLFPSPHYEDTGEQPATNTAEQPATNTAEQPATYTAEQPATYTAEQPATNSGDEKPPGPR
jgi:hypothetical protein